ncbi:MAG: hypothetical protein H0W88_06090 [Parachlamydiaceae bacterium]|nr:hypothetical protein [Parachlamydiaceae bacterium]
MNALNNLCNGISNLFDRACDKGQSHLDLYVSNLPRDTFSQCAHNFMFSSSAGFIIAGWRPFVLSTSSQRRNALISGVLAVVATAVHALCMKGFKQLHNFYADRRSNRAISPISWEERHVAFIVGWGGTLCLADALGLAINAKASFFMTISLRILDIYQRYPHTPVMGTIVV